MRPNLVVSYTVKSFSLQWRHNERYGVSNHRRLECLLIRLLRGRSKKTLKLSVTSLLRGIHRWPVDFPHKRTVTRRMFPFDDVIMFSDDPGRIFYNRVPKCGSRSLQAVFRCVKANTGFGMKLLPCHLPENPYHLPKRADQVRMRFTTIGMKFFKYEISNAGDVRYPD